MIFRNAIKTPDGTIIESKSVHDYVTHVDANGDKYMVDGGYEYLRRSVNVIPAEDLSVGSKENDHEFNRQHFTWGTYGKSGDQPLKRVILKDMETEHINAITGGKQALAKDTREIFTKEIEYRAKNK